MPRHIAIVEDEPAIRENYAETLRRQGYRVSTYSNRPDAIAAFRQQLPELAIIDIGLGDEIEGGFDLCRELRALSPNVPIMFLSARDSDFDVISGLRLGADDYLTKDISLPHLQARIIALFRRMDALAAPSTQEQIIQHGSLTINRDRMSITWRDAPIDVTVTEFWIIHSLARHPGHVKNRDQLMDDANIVVDDTTITSHIKRIRKKFQQVDGDFDCVDTVYGMGYRWKV